MGVVPAGSPGRRVGPAEQPRRDAGRRRPRVRGLAIIWPEEGAISIPSPVGITKDARNVEGARLFVDFVLSREGQQALVSQGIIPVRADVPPPAGMPRPAEIKTLPIPFEWAAENAAEIRRRFEEIMLR